MKNASRLLLLSVGCAGVILLVPGCDNRGGGGSSPSGPLTLAPPGPADLGPATGLSTAPAGSVVFDLKYRPARGDDKDISYYSFWGFGGASAEAEKVPFIREVRAKVPGVQLVENPMLKGREWAAVEVRSGVPEALYFDVNGDGKLNEGERIPTTRRESESFDFVTPDFVNRRGEDGPPVFCRVLLQANNYGNSSTLNYMWSPASLLEGTAALDGGEITVMLFANQPGGSYAEFGSSSLALLTQEGRRNFREYLPRETLSSLIAHQGAFYHVQIEGAYSNGLPARVVLVKDTTPTGELAIRLNGSNALTATLGSVYLRGVEEENVHLRISEGKGAIKLPVANYTVSNGQLRYGTSRDQDWEVSFSGDNLRVAVKEGAQTELTLGQPVLRVTAINEADRYTSRKKEQTVFTRGAKIYLEPKIEGANREIFTRFQKGRNQNAARPPKVVVLAADGRQVFSKTMEYG